MCGHGGCHGVDVIRELKDEHDALLAEAEGVRRALAADDRWAARDLLSRLVGHLASHVRREETGIFAAMRGDGEFVDEVTALEGEHLQLDAGVERLDPDAPDFSVRVAEHIEREDLGLFPVAVVTLGAAGWDRVERAHRETPSFLPERTRA